MAGGEGGGRMEDAEAGAAAVGGLLWQGWRPRRGGEGDEELLQQLRAQARGGWGQWYRDVMGPEEASGAS